jgi:catechol 2,3-dioxygenase-like lactoylglutathione lyase family enzyme
MLSKSKLQTIAWTSRITVAEAFYRDVLGLVVKARSDGAVVFDVDGADLLVSPVASPRYVHYGVRFRYELIYGLSAGQDNHVLFAGLFPQH